MKYFIEALENMNSYYCNVSQKDYEDMKLNEKSIKTLKNKKYLERPFAYEFYHQLRDLIQNGKVDFGEAVLQGEVDKRYQNCFDEGKIPDFLIHKKDAKDKNLYVIEFKIVRKNNKNDIKNDLYKLVEFKENELLKYEELYSVLIGEEKLLNEIEEYIMKFQDEQNGKKINIILFNVDSWNAEQRVPATAKNQPASGHALCHKVCN